MQTTTSASLTQRLLATFRRLFSGGQGRPRFAPLERNESTEKDPTTLSPREIEEAKRQEELRNPTYYLA